MKLPAYDDVNIDIECRTCRRRKRRDCDGQGWLDAIGPCDDGSYISSRPCPNDNPHYETH